MESENKVETTNIHNEQHIGELAKALSKFQGEMKSVAFDAVNPYFKSKYATLSALVKQAGPVLSTCGLAISQTFTSDATVITTLMHESGQVITSYLKLKPIKDDPQGVGSAITYARRYSYAAILGIVSDDDDDGNIETFDKKEEKNETKKEVKSSHYTPPESLKIISESEGKHLISVAEKNGFTKEEVKEYAKTLGYDRLSMLNQWDYEDVLSQFCRPKGQKNG